MDQTCRKTVSRGFGWRSTPAIPAIVLAIALAVPSGSIIAGMPANVVLNNTPTGLTVVGIVVSPNNESVYVAGSAGGVSHLVVMNSRFASITEDVQLTGQLGAIDVAVSRYGRKVYVANYYSNTVSVFSTGANTIEATLTVGPFPLGLAVSPNGKELWVANSGGTPAFNNGTVSVFDARSLAPIASINVGGDPTQVVFEKTSKLAFVLNQSLGGFVSVIDVANHNVKNQNFGGGIVKSPFLLGGAILPDATSLYVDNGYATINNLLVKNGTLKNTVVVFPNTVPPGAQLLGQPVLTRDGKYLYVADPALNQVSWVTTGNDVAQQLSPISVAPGLAPITLAVSPDDTRLYVGNENGYVTQVDITH